MQYKFLFPTGLRIKETKEVYEGEVTELTPCETENPMGGKNWPVLQWIHSESSMELSSLVTEYSIPSL